MNAEESPIRLVVGLGNPGREYEGTRHNVGFAILDRLAAGRGGTWTRERKWRAEVARLGDRVLAKPQTYMNRSGETVAALARFFKLAPESILVVFDDVDLPLGRLRFRLRGSAGGHNGVRSIIQHLGSDDFPRLKFGIGRREGAGGSTTSHVLGRFGEEESEAVEKTLARAQDAVDCALSEGVGAAMNRFNPDPEPPETSRPPTGSEARPQPETETPPDQEE